MSSAARGIVVLGMHRSGTSCVGGLLHAMGAYFGAPDMAVGANAENPRGYFERLDLNRLLDFALIECDARWWRPPLMQPSLSATWFHARLAEILNAVNAHAPWFLKEPRLCLLLASIKSLLPPVAYVHVVRDPLEVALSLQHRNGFSLAHGIALWEMYNVSACNATRDEPRFLLDYASLVADPNAGCTALSDFLERNGIKGLARLAPDRARLLVESELKHERHGEPLREHLNEAQLELAVAITAETLFSEPAQRMVSAGAHALIAELHMIVRGATVMPPEVELQTRRLAARDAWLARQD